FKGCPEVVDVAEPGIVGREVSSQEELPPAPVLPVVGLSLRAQVGELRFDVPLPDLSQRKPWCRRTRPKRTSLREPPRPRLRFRTALASVRPRLHTADSVVVPLHADELAAPREEDADTAPTGAEHGERSPLARHDGVASRAARQPAARAARVLARCGITSIRYQRFRPSRRAWPARSQSGNCERSQPCERPERSRASSSDNHRRYSSAARLTASADRSTWSASRSC